jgi:hypothetical protein
MASIPEVSMNQRNRSVLLPAVYILALLSLLPFGLVAVALADHGGPELGTVNFPVNCRPELQPAFDRAVALLHSFGYDEAREAFAQVAADDPACAMAHWGVAQTYYHPLWAAPTPAELAAGRAASARAAELAAAAGARLSERERGFVAAIGGFWGDEAADHRTRAIRYRDAMAELSRRFPEDSEAAIFHALSILGPAKPNDPTHAEQRRAAEILGAWGAKLPQHPGAIHYAIHAFDSPELAHLGLDAARRYARIAPASAHALHMPSHIFIRLGLWGEAIASNQDSDETAHQTAVRRSSGRASKDELHALDYLEYAYLQTGDDERARAVRDEVARIAQLEEPAFQSAYALAAVPARYALERRQWKEAAALALPESVAVDWASFPYVSAITFYAQTVGAARTGNLPGADEALARLTEQHARLAKNPPPGAYDWTSHVESLRLAAAGTFEQARGNQTEALRLLAAAADLDDRTGKHPVTPGTVLPPRELYAELLLELGRPAEALREYESVLVAAPNRLYALDGAARAADRLGEAGRARTFDNQLAALTSPASKRSEVVAARARLAGGPAR